MLPAESLCVIVLQNREEKSSVNNFDVPRLRFILTLIVDRLLAVCKSIIFRAVRSKSFLTYVFLFCFYFSDTDSDYQVLVQKVNDWCNEVSDWKTLGSDIYIAAQIPAYSVNPSMVFEVGDGKTYDGYENKQLSNGQKYKIYSRGLARRVTKVNEFNSDVARFTIIVRTYRVSYNKIENRLQVFLVGGKTRNMLLNSFCSNIIITVKH